MPILRTRINFLKANHLDLDKNHETTVAEPVIQLPVTKISLLLPLFVIVIGALLLSLGFFHTETFEAGIIAGVCLLFYGIVGFGHLLTVLLHQEDWLDYEGNTDQYLLRRDYAMGLRRFDTQVTDTEE